MNWLRIAGGIAVLLVAVSTLGALAGVATNLLGDLAATAVLAVVLLVVLALAAHGNRFDTGSPYW